MQEIVKILFLGDIVGQPGCRAIFIGLKALIKKNSVDVVVANGENAADGYGLTPDIVRSLFNSGIDVITSGNHIWQRQEIFPHLDSEMRLLRPENYPAGVPGHGLCMVKKNDYQLAVINLEGRVLLSNLRCPFRVAEDLVARISTKTNLIVVDFHAESTEEKEALGLYLDGKVSAIVGTHTHVQTADEKILPQGTGYITDIGMTGPSESVIGMDVGDAMKRSLSQMPIRMRIADKPAVIMGVILELDKISGKTLKIKRLYERASV